MQRRSLFIALLVTVAMLLVGVVPALASAVNQPSFCQEGSAAFQPKTDLVRSIIVVGDQAIGRVRNKSTICSYSVGIASYKKFDSSIDHQEIHDYATAVVPPGAVIDMGPIKLPTCSTQIDLFYGQVLLSLYKQRYNERLLTAKHIDTQFCSGTQGCTPGYWKNHENAWAAAGLNPSQKTVKVFSAASAFPALASKTLLQSLQGGGGSDLAGAAQILLRAAVAALLDANHPGLEYPYSYGQIVDWVNAALKTNNRDTILKLAKKLDKANNLGCPLN